MPKDGEKAWKNSLQILRGLGNTHIVSRQIEYKVPMSFIFESRRYQEMSCHLFFVSYLSQKYLQPLQIRTAKTMRSKQ